MRIKWAHIGALALAGALLMQGAGVGQAKAPEFLPPQPGELVSYTLQDALVQCQTLPADLVTDCVTAAHATDWP